eukprot:scaffold77616_cov55-Attheya_sp.AAC.3
MERDRWTGGDKRQSDKGMNGYVTLLFIRIDVAVLCGCFSLFCADIIFNLYAFDGGRIQFCDSPTSRDTDAQAVNSCVPRVEPTCRFYPMKDVRQPF